MHSEETHSRFDRKTPLQLLSVHKSACVSIRIRQHTSAYGRKTPLQLLSVPDVDKIIIRVIYWTPLSPRVRQMVEDSWIAEKLSSKKSLRNVQSVL